jgi:plasmid stability protein
VLALQEEIVAMAQILVRGLEDKVVELLKARAEKAGRSMEAEARSLLEAATIKEREGYIKQLRRFSEHIFGDRIQPNSTPLIRYMRDHDGSAEGYEETDDYKESVRHAEEVTLRRRAERLKAAMLERPST